MKKNLHILFLVMFLQFYASAQLSPFLLQPEDTIQLITPSRFWNPVPTNRDAVLYTAAPRLVNPDSALLQKYSYHWIMYYDFFTTLTAIHHFNSLNTNDINNIYFYYNLDIKSNFEFRKLKWDLYLFNDYGVRYFFDSLTTKTQDQITFKNSVYYPVYKNKFYISLTANTQTQLFNTHQYRMNAMGKQERFLYDGFMSPGVVIYSGGITYEPGGNSIITLGLGSSKVTKVKNQKIFESRNEETISGVEKGQSRKSELGLSLTATVPLQHFGKHVHWEFYGNAFAPLQKLKMIKDYTIDVNNVLHLLLLKYLRISFRTKIGFSFEQNPKPVIQNQISLGFFLSNHL